MPEINSTTTQCLSAETIEQHRTTLKRLLTLVNKPNNIADKILMTEIGSIFGCYISLDDILEEIEPLLNDLESDADEK